ncbi:hypothetical protein BpHYR1_022898 [Brachionus plicatilis]|uniref:Uncharacterized protein n=1 Tax=Brachionus plicatilis TaxID=10195 RepID=A0A3M7R568_BRAPC|nr:hypothetical protein BpHYR1_022898 [Brachionus plicatilis]
MSRMFYTLSLISEAIALVVGLTQTRLLGGTTSSSIPSSSSETKSSNTLSLDICLKKFEIF